MMRPISARDLTRLQAFAALAAVAGTVALLIYAVQCGERIYWIEHRADARWITTPQPGSRVKAIRVDLVNPPVFTFERQFRLPAVPEQASIEVRGLRDLVLRVNGHPVALPDRDPRRWRRETAVDLAPWLETGVNVLSVEVVHREGPPLLQIWSEDLPSAVATGPGWTVRVGKAVRRAVVANDTRPYAHGDHLPVPMDVVRARWPFLLLAFALSAALTRLVPPAPRAFVVRHAPSLAFGVVALYWLALFCIKALRPHLGLGFDASAHVGYVGFIAEYGRFPRPDENWEAFHPPLYYAATAALRGLLRTEYGSLADRFALHLLPILGGLACAWLAGRTARCLAPGAPGLAAVSVLAAGLLPMNVYMATFVSNEPLHAALVGTGLWLACDALVADRASPRRLAVLSVVLGLGLATKTTTSLPIVALVVVLVAGKLWLVEGRTATRSLVAAAALWLGPVVLAGWFYARNAWLYGDPFVSNLNVDPAWTYWIPPGFHTPTWFFRFGEVLSQPFFASFASYWDGLYSSFWGDGYASGRAGVEFPNPWWDYESMVAIYPLALPATALLGLGLALSCFHAVRGPDLGRRLGWSLLVTTIFGLSLMLLLLTMRLPYNGMPKAFYALPGVVPLAVCFAAGVSWLYGRFGGRLGTAVRAVLAGYLGMLAVSIAVAFLR